MLSKKKVFSLFSLSKLIVIEMKGFSKVNNVTSCPKSLLNFRKCRFHGAQKKGRTFITFSKTLSLVCDFTTNLRLHNITLHDYAA